MFTHSSWIVIPNNSRNLKCVRKKERILIRPSYRQHTAWSTKIIQAHPLKTNMSYKRTQGITELNCVRIVSLFFFKLTLFHAKRKLQWLTGSLIRLSECCPMIGRMKIYHWPVKLTKRKTSDITLWHSNILHS